MSTNKKAKQRAKNRRKNFNQRVRDEKEAAKAYDLEALRFLGGKAKLNLMYVIDETKYEVLAKDNKGITHGLRKDVK